ncbi:taste receptor type 2 member 40-like [Hypomesus transpacificus]|uniref:taste receptor type 2 member 40-like n=1 Tax=Hypomesus transpacificus TaxID=137520 RepID=UPI001F086C57|nr:taste receptor type 2 member 40-like [Hypomesus transpacificus]
MLCRRCFSSQSFGFQSASSPSSKSTTMVLFINTLKFYGMAILLFFGVLWNIFNLVATVVQHGNSRGLQTASLAILFISLSNVLLFLSTFGIIVMMLMGVLCWQELPMFFCVVLYVWLASSSVSFWSIAWLSVFYCMKVVSFSSALLGTIKNNISTVINATLVLTVVSSCVMFAPVLSLTYRNETSITSLAENVTCVIRKPLFPSWMNMNLYVLVFVCYLALFPVMVMLPTSLRMVVHLCKHTMSMRKNQNEFQSADSYLLVCRLTVALVGVYIVTLSFICLFFLYSLFVSQLSADYLFMGYSFYCSATAVLLTISNKSLREKLCLLFCCEKPLVRSRDEKSRETGAA